MPLGMRSLHHKVPQALPQLASWWKYHSGGGTHHVGSNAFQKAEVHGSGKVSEWTNLAFVFCSSAAGLPALVNRSVSTQDIGFVL